MNSVWVAILGSVLAVELVGLVFAQELFPSGFKGGIAKGKIVDVGNEMRGADIVLDFSVTPPTIFLSRSTAAACVRTFPMRFVRQTNKGNEFRSEGEGVISGCERIFTGSVTPSGVTGEVLGASGSTFRLVDMAWTKKPDDVAPLR